MFVDKNILCFINNNFIGLKGIKVETLVKYHFILIKIQNSSFR